ncbi:unnamed protein product, partial [marine sediment metagenome]
MTTGGSIWYRLIPDDFKAIISLSSLSLEKAIKEAKRVAMGNVKNRTKGRVYRVISRTCDR